MTSINTGTSMNDTSSLRSRTVNKTENGTTIVSGNDNSDKDLFLKLLVAQMKNIKSQITTMEKISLILVLTMNQKVSLLF